MIGYQQYMMALRWGMNALGTYLITHGVMNGALWEPIMGLALSGAPFVWGMIRHSKYGTIIAADDIPEVAGVIMKDTAAGANLAYSTTKPTIVVSGGAPAAKIAGAP